ncbi:MAG: YeeE/YedE thiosulfate transporter family protein [Pirellulaceae bacterium]
MMKLFLVMGTQLVVISQLLAWTVRPGTDPHDYPGAAWSPYLVGALIGGLSMLTFYFSDKPLGASTAYARLAGLVGRAVAPKHTNSLKYYQDNKPAVDWEVMLVLGVVLGAFLAAWQGGELTGRWLPPMWEARFGEGSLALRLATALVGGLLMAFGSRLAGGCTSGHGISGALQLSVGSWIALMCFFVGGIATAMLIFRL